MALTLNRWIRLDLSTVSLPVGAGPLLQEHPIIRAAGDGTTTVREHNEIHYDTPDLQLYRHRLALTLNRRGEQWIQRFGVEEGSESDQKWVETPIPDQQLDLKTIRKTPLFPALNGQDARTLAPVFTLHCREQQWALHFPGGLSILLKEERGYLKFGATRQPFHELVLARQAGEEARWFQTALELAQALVPPDKGGGKMGSPERGGPGLIATTPVTRGFAWLEPTLLLPSFREKGASGAGGSPGERGLDGAPAALQVEMTVRQAFVSLCAGLLQQMQVWQGAVLYGGKQAKLAGVQQLYQTTGRLYTLVFLYDTLLPRAVGTELDEELTWLLKELALVQECQALLTETLEPLTEQFATHPGLEELLLKTRNGLILAIKRLERSLVSFRYTRLLLGLENWLTGHLWDFLLDPAQRTELDLPVMRLVADWLQQCHTQVRKRGRKWSDLDLAGRIALRDDIDRMMHATLLFADLFARKKPETTGRLRPPDALLSFQECLQRLQGTMHLLVNVQTSSRFLTRGGSGRDGAQPVQEWQEARVQRRLADAGREWELFAGKLAFWQQG
ncbi:MAG: CHAD domain-containing protein [Magnetococcus sp. DMHC-8]